VIISRGRKYIFVHAPKTGGTSLQYALETRAMKDDILIGNTPKAQNRRRRQAHLQELAAGRLWKHSTLRDIRGVVTDAELDELFIFMLVRNPWDRYVSYYHWLQEQEFEHKAVQLATDLSFSEFLNHPAMQGAITKSPYSIYTRDHWGQDRCSLAIRLEHLEADVTALESHLGFKLDIPHLNPSRRDADWRSYYSEKDARLLSKLCAEDIARFGYAYG